MSHLFSHLEFGGIKINVNNLQKVLYSVYAESRGQLTLSKLLFKVLIWGGGSSWKREEF